MIGAGAEANAEEGSWTCFAGEHPAAKTWTAYVAESANGAASDPAKVTLTGSS